MRQGMKNFLFLPGLLAVFSVTGQALIIDRNAVALFGDIPLVYRDAAADLRMVFMDRSVGFNISTYLDCLSVPFDEAASACKRYQHQDPAYAVDPVEVMWDGTWDRSRWQYAFWPEGCGEDVTCFIDYMEPRLDSFDVMGCQFSYLAVAPGSRIADTLTGFFGSQGDANKASAYAAFAASNPDKKLIWWTTSLARGIGTPESQSFNDQMRAYASEHDVILFDVADILSHAPDGTPCYDNRDGIPYKDEDHPDDGLDIPAICPQYTTETEGGHLGSISAGGVRVAKAFWVLMARLAGWQPESTATSSARVVQVRLAPNPARDLLCISWDERVQGPDAKVTLIDILGRSYSLPAIRALPGMLECVVSHIPEGFYWCRLEWAGRTGQAGLVIQ